jgi:DHA1 family inner membrane transport protein
VLISLAVRFAGQAPTLGSALSVSVFNFATAVGSWIAGRSLDSAVGDSGPAVVGIVIAALTLVPTIALAVIQRRRAATPATAVLRTPEPGRTKTCPREREPAAVPCT